MEHTNKGAPRLRLSSCSRHSMNISSVVDRLGRNPHCFFRQKMLCLTVVTEPLGDHFEEHLACMGHERDATVAAALRPILVMEHLNDGVFPSMRLFYCHLHFE